MEEWANATLGSKLRKGFGYLSQHNPGVQRRQRKNGLEPIKVKEKVVASSQAEGLSI
jgi:hypothetical protein